MSAGVTWMKRLLAGWLVAVIASFVHAAITEPDAWALNVILIWLAWQAMALLIAIGLLVLWITNRTSMPGWVRWLSLGPIALSLMLGGLIVFFFTQG